MGWVGWVGLAGALALLAGPGAWPVRTTALAGRGRLDADDALRRTPPRLPWPTLAALAGVAAVLAGYRTGGAPVAVAALALTATAVTLTRDAARRRAAAVTARELRGAVRVLVGELEAGAAAPAALSAAAAVAPHSAAPFRHAATAATRGDDAAEPLMGSPDARIRVIGVAWRLGERTGAALAGVLGRVAADLDDDEARRRAVAAALAGPRSSATLLAGLPALGIALGAAMGAQPLTFLFTGAAGRMVCCAGVLLDVSGLLWLRRILQRAARAP